jgi:thiamine-monophosphate kinase
MSEAQQRTEINDLGEFGLIDRLTKDFTTHNAGTVLGIGDDAAIIDSMGKHTVLSTDLLVEDIHFDLKYTPLKHLGYKAVVVNLSDIYAMNAKPTQILVSLAISNRFSVEALEEIYEGMLYACDKYHVDLIGGDTTSSPKGLTISITAIGEVADGKQVLRSGAQKGDLICVSGDLGAAYLGLLILEREKKIFLEHPEVQPSLDEQTYLIGRLLKPEARKDIVELLEQEEIVPTAMIDISDGLSSEILHICKASDKGCVLYEEKIPIHDDAREYAIGLGMDYSTATLNGGEDYELLFTIPQSDYDKIKNSPFVSVIGYITDAEEGKHFITKSGNKHSLVAQGWQHKM